MFAMRPTRHFASLVLAWFVLALGVAVASPLVKPQFWQMVCSASGVVKLLNVGDNGVASAETSQIECPLCWLAGAPPPVAALVGAAQPVPHAELPSSRVLPVASRPAPPLPARGPPVFA